MAVLFSLCFLRRMLSCATVSLTAFANVCRVRTGYYWYWSPTVVVPYRRSHSVARSSALAIFGIDFTIDNYYYNSEL